RTVAIIVKKPACRGNVSTRNAVVALPCSWVAAEFVLRFVELHETANEEIQLPITVVVEPNRAGRPSRRCEPPFFGYIVERPIAVVVVQDAAAILRDVQIGEAVSVVIPYSGAHAVATPENSSLLRHVSERAVAVVAIKRVAKRRLWIVEIALAAVDQVDVHPTVVVIIEESATGSGRFRQVVFRRAPVYMTKGDAASRCGYLFEQWEHGFLTKKPRSSKRSPCQNKTSRAQQLPSTQFSHRSPIPLSPIPFILP